MKKFLLSIFLIAMLTESSVAEKRDQGKNISDWEIYTQTKGKITQGTFNSIEFSGKKMETGYRLYLSHKQATRIEWEMEFTEFYAVYLKVTTTKGKRTLRYTSLDNDIGKKNGYINFGLGSDSRKYYTDVTRNIEKDIEKFEPENKLISMDSMMVRGSGGIGNIRTISALKEVVIEDANNGIKNWSIFTNTKGTTTRFQNQVKLLGKGMKTGYALNFPKLDNDLSLVSWGMKYDENYAIYLLVNTTNGVKYLRYSSLYQDKGIDGRYISFGLGSSSKNGKWRTVIRDVKRDLSKFEPDNKILSIKSFMIRGSGLVDNIKVLENIPVSSIKNFNFERFNQLIKKKKESYDFARILDTGYNRIKMIHHEIESADYTVYTFYTLSSNQKELKELFSFGDTDNPEIKDITFNSDHTIMKFIINYPTFPDTRSYSISI